VRYILSRAHRPLLERLARSDTVLAFDYDGTLAPIVANPDRAFMQDRTCVLLKRAATVFPCVILSGRARNDLLHRLDGIPFAAVIGNHGLEPSPEEARFERLTNRWTPVLERELNGLRGVRIENKGLSMSVHFRHAPSERVARETIEKVANELPAAVIVPGIKVVNIVPEGAPDKADALFRLKHELGCKRSLFFGDDVTDETVFEHSDTHIDIGVRVGLSKMSKATFYVRSRGEVDRVVRLLLAERESVLD
jgi:trehalose 6-phosphate phosphatase